MKSLPRISKRMNRRASLAFSLLSFLGIFNSFKMVLQSLKKKYTDLSIYIHLSIYIYLTHHIKSLQTILTQGTMIPHSISLANNFCLNHVTGCGFEAHENNPNHISGKLRKVACQKREVLDHTSKLSVQQTLEMRSSRGYFPQRAQLHSCMLPPPHLKH